MNDGHLGSALQQILVFAGPDGLGALAWGLLGHFILVLIRGSCGCG